MLNFHIVFSVLCTITALHVTFGAPVQGDNILKSFVATHKEKGCKMLVPFTALPKFGDGPDASNSTVLDTLKVCNVGSDDVLVPFCSEIFSLISDLSTCKRDEGAPSDVLPQPKPITVTMENDVCVGFFASRSMFAGNADSFASRLGDQDICRIICKGSDMQKACSFLLWGHRVQSILNGTEAGSEQNAETKTPAKGTGAISGSGTLTKNGDGSSVVNHSGIGGDAMTTVEVVTKYKKQGAGSTVGLSRETKDQKGKNESAIGSTGKSTASSSKGSHVNGKDGHVTLSTVKGTQVSAGQIVNGDSAPEGHLLETQDELLSNISRNTGGGKKGTKEPKLIGTNDQLDRSSSAFTQSELLLNDHDTSIDTSNPTDMPESTDEKVTVSQPSDHGKSTSENLPGSSDGVTEKHMHSTENSDSTDRSQKAISGNNQADSNGQNKGSSSSQGSSTHDDDTVHPVSGSTPKTDMPTKDPVSKTSHLDNGIDSQNEIAMPADTPPEVALQGVYSKDDKSRPPDDDDDFADLHLEDNSNPDHDYDDEEQVNKQPSQQEKESVSNETPGSESQVIPAVEAVNKNIVPVPFPDQEDNHFFFYFITIIVFAIGGYVLFHNKQKIFALIIEGRHERRRRSGASYRKLETK